MRSPQALSAGPAPSCAAPGRGRAAHTVITPPRGVYLRASCALERARLRHERCRPLRRPRNPKGAQPISARARRRLDRAPDRARRGRAARVRPLPIRTVASPPSLGPPMAPRGSFRSQSSTTAPCRSTTATTARPGVPRTVKAPSPPPRRMNSPWFCAAARPACACTLPRFLESPPATDYPAAA